MQGVKRTSQLITQRPDQIVKLVIGYLRIDLCQVNLLISFPRENDHLLKSKFSLSGRRKVKPFLDLRVVHALVNKEIGIRIKFSLYDGRISSAYLVS